MACDHREAGGRSTEEIQSTHPQRLPPSTNAIFKRREYDLVGGRSQIGMQNAGFSTCNAFDNRIREGESAIAPQMEFLCNTRFPSGSSISGRSIRLLSCLHLCPSRPLRSGNLLSGSCGELPLTTNRHNFSLRASFFSDLCPTRSLCSRDPLASGC